METEENIAYLFMETEKNIAYLFMETEKNILRTLSSENTIMENVHKNLHTMMMSLM